MSTSNCDRKETIELLKEINAGCKSATNSMEQVIQYVNDDKLKNLIHTYNKSHVDIGDECHKLLNQYNEEEKDPNKVSSAMAYMGTQMKLMVGADSAKIAGLLMDGCNMGIKSLSKYVNQYPCASKQSKVLADKLIKEEERFMMSLKEYL